MKWVPFFLIFCAILVIFCIFLEISFYRKKILTLQEIKRIQFLSPMHTKLIKGLSILIIVLGHYMGLFGNGTVLFTPCGGIGVAMFLMVSGYGLNESYKKKGLDRWWCKRLETVWVPYGIVQLIFYWSRNRISPIIFLGDMTLIRCMHPLGWYLSYLLLWYVAYWIALRIRIFYHYRWFIWGIVAVVLFFAHKEIVAEQSMSFLMGVLVSELNLRYRICEAESRSKAALIGFVSLAYGILFLAIKQLPTIRAAHPLVMKLVQLMIKLPCAMGIILLSYVAVMVCISHLSRDIRIEQAPKIGNRFSMMCIRFLIWVSGISYAWYLIHWYIFEVVDRTYRGAGLCLITSIVLAWGYSRLLQLIPMK